MAILQRLPSHPPAIIYFVLHCTRNSNDGNRMRWLPTPPITAPVPPLWICTEPRHHILPPTATAHTRSSLLHEMQICSLWACWCYEQSHSHDKHATLSTLLYIRPRHTSWIYNRPTIFMSWCRRGKFGQGGSFSLHRFAGVEQLLDP